MATASANNRRLTAELSSGANHPHSSNVNRESSSTNKKLSSQKSAGSINQRVASAKGHSNLQSSIDGSSSAAINEIMTKYIKQSSQGQTVLALASNNGGQAAASTSQEVYSTKSRNSNMISSSKTVADTMNKATSSSKTNSRPITANNYG